MFECREKLPEQSLELKVDLRPTCIILARSPDGTCYLVTGDSNGSICFYLNGIRVMRYACPSACYDKGVTALTYGNLLNKDDDEENLVIVHADGYLQAITLPKMDYQGLSISKPPTEVFFDLLDVNICSATICDIDSDSKNELVALFVNGAVRLYRFEVDEGLKEVQVWDFQCKITCFSLGRYRMNFFSAFVLTSDKIIHKLVFFPSTSITPQLKLCRDSCCIFPINCVFSTLYGSDVEKVFAQVHDIKSTGVINKELKKVGQQAISCIGTTVFRSGTQVIVTGDCDGRICVYAWIVEQNRFEDAVSSNYMRDVKKVCWKHVDVDESQLDENTNIFKNTNETSLGTNRSIMSFRTLACESKQKTAACNLCFSSNIETDWSADELTMGNKQSYIVPCLCSKLGTFPVLLTVHEDSEDDQLLLGIVSIDKRIHLYRYKINQT